MYYWSAEQPKSSICHAFFEKELDSGEYLCIEYIQHTYGCIVVYPKILTELEYSGIGRNKEQSARLLRHMIANAPKLVKPYQEPILKVISIYMHYANMVHYRYYSVNT